MDKLLDYLKTNWKDLAAGAAAGAAGLFIVLKMTKKIKK
ncbi:hypothetical protein X275_08270 [Marinitoga sp. 1197]|nr:hypothetical protein X275_08270 [Marinitoga sp. 1197]